MMTSLLPLSLLIGAFSGPVLKGAGGEALPLSSSEVEATITGDIATVHVTQVYVNPKDRAIDGRYLFPLPHDAAVYAMKMEVAGKLIEARIARVEEAKAEFAKAKEQGKTAALLEEHRANVFTQDVANIPPGDRVTITIAYAQTVLREDGDYVFHVPLAVGARYANGASGISVPALDKPLPEAEPVRARTGIRVDLRTGLPIRSLVSPSHQIEVDTLSASHQRIALAAGKIPADRDFVLKYRLASKEPRGSLIAHRDRRGEFFTALIEPPLDVPAGEIIPRELVFVIDASCSMDGPPLEASKRLINTMLDRARPTDTFRVIVFGASADAFSGEALPANRDNVARAKRWIAGVSQMGGTEIELGVRAALRPDLPGGRLRMVVFLTDGYIGDEASVMATIHQERKSHTTIFTFGVGSGVNRWLLEEMAIAGRGAARVVDVNEDPNVAADALAERLRAPILTNLSIDWGGADVREVTPSPLLDLYAGQPLRILGRFANGTRPKEIALVGWRGGKPLRIPVSIDGHAGASNVYQVDDVSNVDNVDQVDQRNRRRATRSTSSPAAEAIPILWARGQIADRMRAMTRPHPMRGAHDGSDDRLVEEITRLGLEYAITTRWTALVAVSDHQVPPAEPQPPLPSFSSAPEPAEWAAMLLLTALAIVALRERARGRV